MKRVILSGYLIISLNIVLMNRIIKIITDIIIISLISLILCEGGLYLIGWGDPVIYMRDNKCRYRITPNQKRYMCGTQVNINSLAMRGGEPDKNKKNMFFLEIQLLLVPRQFQMIQHLLELLINGFLTLVTRL